MGAALNLCQLLNTLGNETFLRGYEGIDLVLKCHSSKFYELAGRG
jgi:hypothetical protein